MNFPPPSDGFGGAAAEEFSSLARVVLDGLRELPLEGRGSFFTTLPRAHIPSDGGPPDGRPARRCESKIPEI